MAVRPFVCISELALVCLSCSLLQTMPCCVPWHDVLPVGVAVLMGAAHACRVGAGGAGYRGAALIQ